MAFVTRHKLLVLMFFANFLALLSCKKSNYATFPYDSSFSSQVALSTGDIAPSVSKIVIYKTNDGSSNYSSKEEMVVALPSKVISNDNDILNIIESIRSSISIMKVEIPEKSQKEVFHIILFRKDQSSPGYIRFIKDLNNRKGGHIESWRGSGSYYRNETLASNPFLQ